MDGGSGSECKAKKANQKTTNNNEQPKASPRRQRRRAGMGDRQGRARARQKKNKWGREALVGRQAREGVGPEKDVGAR